MKETTLFLLALGAGVLIFAGVYYGVKVTPNAINASVGTCKSCQINNT